MAIASAFAPPKLLELEQTVLNFRARHWPPDRCGKVRPGPRDGAIKTALEAFKFFVGVGGGAGETGERVERERFEPFGENGNRGDRISSRALDGIQHCNATTGVGECVTRAGRAEAERLRQVASQLRCLGRLMDAEDFEMRAAEMRCMLETQLCNAKEGDAG